MNWRHMAWGATALVLVVAVVVFGHVYILQWLASILVVEDALEPAQAIVVLSGQVPFREMEAAALYKAGWASRVILVRGTEGDEDRALRSLGFETTEGWELSYKVLAKLGVPPPAILVPAAQAETTLDELQIAFRAIRPDHAPVILVTSKYHARRARLAWDYVAAGQSPGIVRPASGDPFDTEEWWRNRQFIHSVVREYLGLVNYWLQVPVVAQSAK